MRIWTSRNRRYLSTLVREYENIKTFRRYNERAIQGVLKRMKNIEIDPAPQPEVCGQFEYYSEINDKNTEIYRKNIASMKTECVLDVSKMAYWLRKSVNISIMKPSPQNIFIGFLFQIFDHSESKNFQFCLYDSSKGEYLAFKIRDSTQSLVENISDFEWKVDEMGRLWLIFVLFDTSRRPYQVCCTDIDKIVRCSDVGKGNSKFRSVEVDLNLFDGLYTENDESFRLDISHSKDGKHIFVHSQSKSTTEVLMIASFCNGSTRSLICRPLSGRTNGNRVFFDHAGSKFFISTNKMNGNGDLEIFVVEDDDVSVKVLQEPGRLLSIMKPLWPRKDTVSNCTSNILLDYDCLNRYCVVYQKKDGESSVDVIDMNKDYSTTAILPLVCKSLNIPNQIWELSPHVNGNDNSSSFGFSLSNPLIPEFHCQYDIQTQKINVTSRVDTSLIPKFQIAQDWVISHDQTKVPITIVSPSEKKWTTWLESTPSCRPTLLVGYGAYGKPLPIFYQEEFVELLQRGWRIAFAHIRGGGEFGKKWHVDGSGLKKWNSFHDFVSCAHYLIDKGFTSPKQLCSRTDSAGGLLAGTLANFYPDLFVGHVMRSPFLDIFNTMNNPTLPLTVHEYEEWGNPSDNREIKEYLLSYCPTYNIRSQNYPHLFISVGLQDFQVPFQQSLHWINEVRRAHTGASSTWHLLMPWEYGGHDGPYQAREQKLMKGFEIAFLENITSRL